MQTAHRTTHELQMTFYIQRIGKSTERQWPLMMICDRWQIRAWRIEEQTRDFAAGQGGPECQNNSNKLPDTGQPVHRLVSMRCRVLDNRRSVDLQLPSIQLRPASVARNPATRDLI
mmetsp:Transcript_23030/g.36689  ORF Transcript_23030/g.36689 Transcript_23030/m.36689 type:complete len:116 (+) Transcript_23030:288-635(+)